MTTGKIPFPGEKVTWVDLRKYSGKKYASYRKFIKENFVKKYGRDGLIVDTSELKTVYRVMLKKDGKLIRDSKGWGVWFEWNFLRLVN